MDQVRDLAQDNDAVRPSQGSRLCGTSHVPESKHCSSGGRMSPLRPELGETQTLSWESPDSLARVGPIGLWLGAGGGGAEGPLE